MRLEIIMILIALTVISISSRADDRETLKITIEKVWEAEGPYVKAYLDPQTGNMILECKEGALDRSIRVVRPDDGKLLQTIELEPSLKAKAEEKFKGFGVIEGSRKAKRYYQALDKTGSEYDDAPCYSPNGHFMAKLRWRFSTEKKEYEAFIQLFEMKERGYVKRWECKAHPFWNENYNKVFMFLADGTRAVEPGTGPKRYWVLPGGEVLFSFPGSYGPAPEYGVMLYANGELRWRFDRRPKNGLKIYSNIHGLLKDNGKEVLVACGKKDYPDGKKKVLIGIGLDGEVRWTIPFDRFPCNSMHKMSSLWPPRPRLALTFEVNEKCDPLIHPVKPSPEMFAVVDPEGNITHPYSPPKNTIPEYSKVLSTRYYLIKFHLYPMIPVFSSREIDKIGDNLEKLEEYAKRKYQPWLIRNPYPLREILYDATRKEVILDRPEYGTRKEVISDSPEKAPFWTKPFPVLIDPSLPLFAQLSSIIVSDSRRISITFWRKEEDVLSTWETIVPYKSPRFKGDFYDIPDILANASDKEISLLLWTTVSKFKIFHIELLRLNIGDEP